jgi:hypothetical protein
MTIEQTVEIPPNHRLTIEVPREIPAGKAILAFTPVSLPETNNNGEKIRLTRPMVDELLRSKALRSLTGLLHTDMDPDEIRAERLKKYDRLA